MLSLKSKAQSSHHVQFFMLIHLTKFHDKTTQQALADVHQI